MSETFFETNDEDDVVVLRLLSNDGTNRLTRACIMALADKLHELRRSGRGLVFAGNQKFFSAGAELRKLPP
jgi:enoyl-CoA hydratase/carnithine racemase